MLKPILLVEDNPNDLELTLLALDENDVLLGSASLVADDMDGGVEVLADGLLLAEPLEGAVRALGAVTVLGTFGYFLALDYPKGLLQSLVELMHGNAERVLGL